MTDYNKLVPYRMKRNILNVNAQTSKLKTNRVMTKYFDTHAHDYNAQHGKACSQTVSELSRIGGTGYLTYLIKL